MSVIGAHTAEMLAMCALFWCCRLFELWYPNLYSMSNFLILMEKTKLAWYLQWYGQASVNYQ